MFEEFETREEDLVVRGSPVLVVLRVVDYGVEERRKALGVGEMRG